MSSRARALAALFAAIGVATAAADARPHRTPQLHPMRQSTRVAFMGYLHNKRVATVYTDGRVVVAPQKTAPATDRRAKLQALLAQRRNPQAFRTTTAWISPRRYGPLDASLPQAVRAQVLHDVEFPAQRYVPNRVLVVFKDGVTMPQDHQALTPSAAQTLVHGIATRNAAMTPHAFTTDARINRTLMTLGVDKADRIGARLDRGTLSSMRARANARGTKAVVPIENAFVLHVAGASVEKAVRTLRASTSVAYVSPDYTVSSMLAGRHPIPAGVQTEMAGYRRTTKTFGRAVKSTSVATSSLPSNAAIQFNAQAMLGASGVDAVAAYDEITRTFGQLPGTGEIITNVSTGDVDDASAGTNPNDPCYLDVVNGGATTHLVGGQRYLDLPSLPLIPVWTADTDGNLSPAGEACNVDASLGEVGLDFSVMAPLPHDQQRPGEVAAAANLDLLGIAPGASYRWVAPGTADGAIGISELIGAFLGAARQVPAPNVITASLGWGADIYGFPGRYLEDDPLMQGVISSIVSSGVVVCISANDGTRMYQLSAVGPSGGSAATNAGTSGLTTLDDVYYSTTPSVVQDSGAIDVGATTLDDIFAVNPQDAAAGALGNQSTFAETRYNGMMAFSSGFGSRVNISAPGDNVEALFHAGAAYDAVAGDISGGTSASAPEVAAAAAIALQVARLTGHPLTSPLAVRDALVASATPVANPPQLDVTANVGPQVNVRRLVESMLAAAGKPVQPGIARVAVHGRRYGSFLAQGENGFVDGLYVTALDPAFVKLDGPYAIASAEFPGSDTGAELNSYITIAPDWEAIPPNATYRLTVAGQPSRVIATTPRVRMLPAQLLAAAGVSLQPGVSRTISLTYSAAVGLHTVAESTFQLTFGPPASSSRVVLAPVVPPVVTGATIPVAYDVRQYPTALAHNPTLNVSVAGEGTALFTGTIGGQLVPQYATPLPSTHGTINVPTSALTGGGVYTVWIDMAPGMPQFDYSDPAFVRVDAGAARPPAPLLSGGPGQTAYHSLEVPYKSTFAVTYDVSNVPRANGAIVEISAPPPAPLGKFYDSGLNSGENTFRNPNGDRLDEDGIITGSIYHVAATGTSGTVTIDPTVAGIPATVNVNVRVLPTNGGTPIAEASDADTVHYHGISGALGLPLFEAHANPAGSDGYLGEGAVLTSGPNGISFYAFEPFDTASATVTGTPLTTTTPNTAFVPIVQNDTGVVGTAPDGMTMSFFRATPVEAPFTQFSLPSSTFTPTTWLWSAAGNSSPTRSAYVMVDFGSGSILVAAGDVTTGAFSPAVDITALLGPNFDSQGIGMPAYDAGLDRVYILNEDATLPCDAQSPQLITVDFATNSASVRTLPIAAGKPGGFNYGLAIDPTTHTGAIATNCLIVNTSGRTVRSELDVLDLSSGALTNVVRRSFPYEQQTHGNVAMPGGDSANVGVDPVNHLVLQRSIFCPQMIGAVDANARPCLNEYDEHGVLVKTIPGLFTDGVVYGAPTFSGVNGTTRTGIAFGQEAYDNFDMTFEAQPYSY